MTDGRFSEVLCPDTGEQGVDLEGQYVIPGLIDVHSHGNSGADFSDGACDGVGTHEELLKTSQVYRDIYQSQYGREALAQAAGKEAPIHG